jgi:hypothetical protein
MKPAILFMVFCAAGAQTTAEDVPAIGGRWKQNTEALRAYSHKRRVEIRVKGQVRASRVELIRYVNGEKETIPLETPSQSAGPARGGGLRGRMVQKKKAEMKEEVERLNQLLGAYISPPSGMRDLLEKATISRTGAGPDAAIQVAAKGVVEPSDSLTLTWSVARQRPEKIEIRSTLNGKPVEAAVEFTALPEGPFYAARTVVSAPKNDLVIHIDEFDYTRGGEPRQ